MAKFTLDKKLFYSKESFELAAKKYAENVAKKDAALIADFECDALGGTFIYDCSDQTKTNCFLLLCVGTGGYMSCNDTNGVRARRFHTHEQLQAVLSALDARINAIMTLYYQNKAAVLSSDTPELIEINYESI